MDQDETTAEAVPEASGARRGKVIQTLLVRVTLRENEDGDPDGAGKDAVPTNERVAELVERALYDDLAYFDADSINATAEKV